MKKRKIYRLFFDFEKEEKWLNKMSTKGLHFTDYFLSRYLFEEGNPNEYTYRLELLKNPPDHPESKAYIKFMEDSGVEYVAKWVNWVYFRKKTTDGPFDLYSDYASKISHYKRIVWLVGFAAGLNLLIGIFNFTLGLKLGLTSGVYDNCYISLISFSVVALFTPMLLSYIKTIRRLKSESKIFE